MAAGEPARLDRLTPREREVLALMAEGLTNAEIAARLQVTFPTAKTHVSAVLQRLDVESREDAVAIYRAGLAARTRRTASRSFWPAAWWLKLTGAAGLAGGAGAAVVAIVLYLGHDASTPPSPLQVHLADLPPETPVEYHVDGLGADQYGRAYSLFVVRHDDGSVQAFLGRDPSSNCTVGWDPDYRLAGRLSWAAHAPAATGASHALCSGWAFARDGVRIFGGSPRGLDGYPVAVSGDTATVRFDEVILGRCSLENTPELLPCSETGLPMVVESLPPPFIPDWGMRTPPTSTAAATATPSAAATGAVH